MRVGSWVRGVRGVVVTVVAAAVAVAVPSATASAADGPGWQLVSAGELGETTYLGAVSAAGPHAAWAAGYQVINAEPQGLMLRWDGREWQPDEAPGLPEVIYWLSVSAESSRNVWAYGRVSGDTYVMARFDGRRWRTTEMPEQPDHGSYGITSLEAVNGRTWLAGEEAISGYAHGEWETLDLEPGTNIVDLHAPTARDAWAVGPYWSADPDERRPVVLHWEGGDWSEVPLDRPELHPRHVYAESDDSVYVVALEYLDETYTPQVLHWDGREWEDVSGPMTDMFVSAVTGDGHGTVWFSGDPGGYEGPPEFWRYDARRDAWTRVDGAMVEGDTHAHQVSDLAPIGRNGGYWAVGTYHQVVGENRADEFELIFRARR